MEWKETCRYAMFGAAAALFVVGGLMAGQVMGGRPLQLAQAAYDGGFDYVTRTDSGPADADSAPADDGNADADSALADDGNADEAGGETPTSSSDADSDNGAGEPQNSPDETAVVQSDADDAQPAPTTSVPEAEPTSAPATPAPAQPTPDPGPQQQPEAPADEPANEQPEEPAAPEEPSAEEPGGEEPADPPVEPDPDPDPEGEGDGVQVVVPTDPCIFNPELPECDDVTIAPKLPWHPCTFSLDPCPGEEEDDEIIINPGLIGEIDWCEITDCDAPEIQVVAPIEPPTDPVQPVYFNPNVIDPQTFDLPLGQPQHP